MNKQKELWKTVLVSAITSVIVFVLLGQLFGAPMFSPGALKTGQVQQVTLDSAVAINAKACNADEVCEANEILIENILSNNEYKSTFKPSWIEQSYSSQSSGTVESAYLTYRSVIIEEKYPNEPLYRLELNTGGIIASKWKSPQQVNGFACIDPNGVMYRSDTACA